MESCTRGQVLLTKLLGLARREKLRRAHGMAVETDRATVSVKRHERLWAPFKQVGLFAKSEVEWRVPGENYFGKDFTPDAWDYILPAVRAKGSPLPNRFS